MKFLSLKSKDIGIDLGTSNILVTIAGKGIVYNEPAAIAIDKENMTVIAVGGDAKEMIGRTPDNISAIKPMDKGVIADLTATGLMLKSILSKVCEKYSARRPRVVVGIPTDITEVETRAVQEAIMQAGAKEVYLVEEPIAAAIGASMEIVDASGNIIVDIGGGTTEVAIISLGGIVVTHALRVAGNELDKDIINYVKREYNLLIGENTAEEIKKEIGSAAPLVSKRIKKVKGRDLATGLPREIEITSDQVEEAIRESIRRILDVIKLTLEQTPPELSSDIMEKGIMLSGGGALIENFDKLLSEETGIPVYIAENPLYSVVIGTERVLENIEKLKSVLFSSKRIIPRQ